MKLFKFAILALLISFASSCKDDVDMDCSQSAWIGTYTGTQDCDGNVEAVTVTIVASSGSDTEINIKYDNLTSSLEISNLVPEECTINTETFVDLDITLDGENLEYITTFPAGSSISVCTITAIRD